MNELLAFALVCSIAVPAPDCTRDNALDVIVSPAHSIAECAMHAQAAAAAAGLPGAEGRYLKIECRRRRQEAEARP